MGVSVVIDGIAIVAILGFVRFLLKWYAEQQRHEEERKLEKKVMSAAELAKLSEQYGEQEFAEFMNSEKNEAEKILNSRRNIK